MMLVCCVFCIYKNNTANVCCVCRAIGNVVYSLFGLYILYIDEFTIGFEVEQLDVAFSLPEQTFADGDAGLIGGFLFNGANIHVGDVVFWVLVGHGVLYGMWVVFALDKIAGFSAFG